jgi:hypothetical protein
MDKRVGRAGNSMATGLSSLMPDEGRIATLPGRDSNIGRARYDGQSLLAPYPSRIKRRRLLPKTIADELHSLEVAYLPGYHYTPPLSRGRKVVARPARQSTPARSASSASLLQI